MAEILNVDLGLPLDAQSSLAAGLVILGVVLKNSMEQMKMGDSKLGVAAFILGWILFANAVGRNAINAGVGIGLYLPYVASALIVFSVMSMKMIKSGSEADKMKRMMPYLAGFVVGWILLGYSVGQYRVLSAISVGLVFIAMMYFLPKQRKKCVVDGPGLPLFMLGWVGMVLANSSGKLGFLETFRPFE